VDLEKKLAEWASDWGVSEVRTPTGAEIFNALFKQPPLEWSRLTHFQDRTMVRICQRLLPEAERRDIYLQGASSFKLPKGHHTVSVYCSAHNSGARELAEELNAVWPGLLQVANVQSWANLGGCDHMLVYLNALTWTHEPESFAADIREAQRAGLHLQPCHEFPSVLDSGSSRRALEFKQIHDSTPADLRQGPTNIYSQIGIALKGGELREPGLANLAARLAMRTGRTSRVPAGLLKHEGVKPPAGSSQTVRCYFSRILRPAVVEGPSDVGLGACHPDERSPSLWRRSRSTASRRSTTVNNAHSSCTPSVRNGNPIDSSV